MADVGFVDQASDEIEADWATVRFDFDRDTVIAEAPDGSIGAYGIVLAPTRPSRSSRWGRCIRPRGSRARPALLAETERRAGARLLAGARAPFRTGTPETDAPRSACLRRAATGTFDPSGICSATSASTPPPSLPRASRCGSGAPATTRAAYRVLDDAFRDHFGYEPIEQADWLDEFRGVPGYDPTLR